MALSIKKKIAALIVTGLIIATLGILLYLSFPIIMKSEIEKRLVLKEGSEAYKYWKDIPVPIYLDFYLFNITNPEEIWAKTNKPVLEQLGPYTFREEREKVNVTWNSNGTLRYKQIRKWYYESDLSNGSLSDNVTTLNVPMFAAAAKGKALDQIYVYFVLQELFAHLNCTWFVTKTVGELLFEGYEDELMKAARRFVHLPYVKFGWFYARNDTDDGEVVAYTGEDDIETVDEIYSWKDMREVPAYEPPCSMINGSAGDFWPPNLTRDSKVSLFVTDICRSMSFTYLKDVEVKKVKVFRYWADSTELDNGKYNPDHKCFCSGGICLPSGAINVSTCKFDAPAVVSYPHFLFADSIYSQGVIGMHPDPEKHRMYLDIVPELGIPISVAARMQINIVFEGIPQLEQFENITERIYFPVLWFSETAQAGDDILGQLFLLVTTLPLAMNIVLLFIVSIGGFLVLSGFVLSILYALGKTKPNNSTVLVPPEKE